MSKLTPAEKVARAAARIIDAVDEDRIQQVRETHERVKGVGGFHYISNGRLIALADAVEEWKLSQ